MEIKIAINGLEINETTTDSEIYNHIGIPSKPFIMKPEMISVARMEINPDVMKQMFGNGIKVAK